MKKKIILGIVLILAVICIAASMYTVEENEFACVVRFSEIIDTTGEAGLHFKVPFLDSVRTFPKAVMLYDIPPSEVLPQDIQHMIYYGTGGRSVKVHYQSQRGQGVYDMVFEGLIKNVERRYRETASDSTKQEYETFMRTTPCKMCKGKRLKKESLAQCG